MLIRSRNNLGGVGAGLDQSTTILSIMHCRATMNKSLANVVFAVIRIARIAIVHARVVQPTSSGTGMT